MLQINYFFTPNPYALWNDSKFEITHSYKLRDEAKQGTVCFAKDERWTSHYKRRPERLQDLPVIKKGKDGKAIYGKRLRCFQ